MIAKIKNIRIFVGILFSILLITSVAESVTSVDVVEMRGPILTGLTNDPANYSNNIINYSNFAGFYYNFDENVAGEEISVIVDTSSRTVPPHNLTYTSTIMNINYSSDNLRKSGDSKFEMIEYLGEEYVPISAGQANNLSKLLINEGDSINYTIKPGYSIELGENYTISLLQIDIDGDKAWLELTKNGAFVDDQIISVVNATDYASKTWNYKTNFSNISNVVTLRIHVDDVVQNSTGTFVVIEGIWQISDTITEINVDDQVGILNVTSLGSTISMDNTDSFVLSKNTQIDILNNLSLNVADSAELIYYLMKAHTAPGTYEVRGTVWDVPAETPQTKEWTYENFGAFYYDLSSNIGYENITIIVGPLDNRTASKENITYMSTIKDVNYNLTEWTSTYQKIGYFGEEYVPIKFNKANKISKLLMDDDNRYTIRNGNSLELGEGYALVPSQIDAISDTVWFQLTKNGAYVAGKVINASSSNAMSKTWNFTQNVSGETDVETLKISVDQVFQGMTTSLVVIEGIWQISDTVKELTSNDKIGILNVTSVSGDKIVMKNSDDAVNLTRDTVVNITPDIKFRVANDEVQTRIYPFTELKIDGIAPVLSLDIPQSFNDSDILTINLSTSPYSDSLKYSTNATFGILIGNIFKWIPAFVINGTYEVQFTVSDGISTDSNVVSIPVVHEITSPAEQWNRSFGGVNYDSASDVKQTDDGGYILVGKTYSFGTGYGDVWLLKTDSNGIETWNKTFWKGNWSNVYAVLQTNDSGYILAGYADSPADEYSSDAWFIKTDSDGNEIWNKSYGGPNSDYVKDVKQTNDGGYILAGHTESFGQGLSDAWLIKTSSDGIELWNKTFGGVDSDFLNDVQQTSDEGYIFVGYTEPINGDKDAWLVKTDSDGIELWNKTFGGVNDDSANDVKQTSNGGFILVGYTESFGQGQSDTWLVKTDSDGIELWNKTFGGVSYDSANDVKQTSDGGFIIAGQTSSFGIGDNDAWLIKTDVNGNHVWNNMFWSGSGDILSSVQQTSDGGYILAGYTHLFEENDHNIWLMKIENRAPTLVSIGTQTINEAATLTIDLLATDPDGDALNYTTNATFGTLTDNVFKWTPTYSDSGTYNITFTVSDGILMDNKTVTITVNDVQVQTDSSSGGGGGSGFSGEKYENIEVKDVVREYTTINEKTSYEFKEESNAIETIKFTALKNAGEISATIEVLKGKSALVKSDPSGKVYQNMNIWVGKSGFATSNNIADVKVGFKVEKSWIETNGIVVSTIRLCRHHDDVWNPLPTKKSGEDDKYIYFESKTPGFSPFSITGSTEEEVAAQGSAASSMSSTVSEEIGAQSPDADVVDDGEGEQDDGGVSKVWFVVVVLMVIIVGGGAYWLYVAKK